jgi:hypothetical protein
VAILQETQTHLAAFKARYDIRYRVAVRSLMEDDEHPLFVLCLDARACIGIFRPPMRPRVPQSNARQRTDQIDVFTRRVQLPHHRMPQPSGDIHLHPHLGEMKLENF